MSGTRLPGAQCMREYSRPVCGSASTRANFNARRAALSRAHVSRHPARIRTLQWGPSLLGTVAFHLDGTLKLAGLRNLPTDLTGLRN